MAMALHMIWYEGAPISKSLYPAGFGGWRPCGSIDITFWILDATQLGHII